jgi:hypothetical protein
MALSKVYLTGGAASSARPSTATARRGSLSSELGLPVLDPGVEALAVIVGVIELAAERPLEFEPILERGLEGDVERPFRVP